MYVYIYIGVNPKTEVLVLQYQASMYLISP